MSDKDELIIQGTPPSENHWYNKLPKKGTGHLVTHVVFEGTSRIKKGDLVFLKQRITFRSGNSTVYATERPSKNIDGLDIIRGVLSLSIPEILHAVGAGTITKIRKIESEGEQLIDVTMISASEDLVKHGWATNGDRVWRVMEV